MYVERAIDVCWLMVKYTFVALADW